MRPKALECDASQVLKTDSMNVKAVYRRAQCLLAEGDYVLAEQDIKKALGVDPDNRDIKVCLVRRVAVLQRSRHMFCRICGLRTISSSEHGRCHPFLIISIFKRQ